MQEGLSLKERYIDDLKQNMKLAMQNLGSAGGDSERQGAVFSQLLENIS